jgi:alpha-tubulin suppressor-like RCC1 family protein
MSYSDELQPFYISKIPEKVHEIACGEEHTLVLTRTGEVFAMGSNIRGQLGTGGSPSKG